MANSAYNAGRLGSDVIEATCDQQATGTEGLPCQVFENPPQTMYQQFWQPQLKSADPTS